MTVSHDIGREGRADEWRELAPGGLGAAVLRDNARWAAEFGFDSRRQRRPRRWTDAAIEDALRALVAERGRYPSHRDFVRAGLGGLLRTVERRGGHDAWAGRIGVPRRVV